LIHRFQSSERTALLSVPPQRPLEATSSRQVVALRSVEYRPHLAQTQTGFWLMGYYRGHARRVAPLLSLSRRSRHQPRLALRTATAQRRFSHRLAARRPRGTIRASPIL